VLGSEGPFTIRPDRVALTWDRAHVVDVTAGSGGGSTGGQELR
jgi:hypothetical protein